MASSIEQLIFEIITRDKQASAAFDKFRNSVDKTSGSIDKNSAALDRNAKAQDKNKQANTSALGALIGLGAAFPGVAVGAAAAGAGVAAFGVLAVPSVKKVSAALSAKGGLAESWVTLDNRQRNAALGVQALGHDYSDLAKRMEPQVFQVFNQGLTLAHSLLGPTGQLARTSGQGISDFLATFSADSGLQHFIAYLSTIARPAIALAGQDVTHVAHAVFALAQGVGGTALIELRALTGVFTALDDSISFLSQHAPGLTSAGLAIGGIALALSKLGLLSGALKITGISSIAGQMTGFTAATKGATVAEKGLLATTTAFDAITPWGWVALGTAALGGLVFWMSRLSSGADASITAIEKQNKAVGFNAQGYLDAAAAIQKTNAQQVQQSQNLANVHTGIGGLTGVTLAYNSAQQTLIANGRELNAFLGILQARYHVTRDTAIALSQTSGVLVDKNGKLVAGFGQSVSKAEAFGDANVKARLPVVGLANAVNDLTLALNKNVTAVLTELGDQLSWQSALQQSRAQLAGNSAGLRGNTANAIANRQAVLASTNAAVVFAASQLKTGSNLRGATGEIQQQIRYLQSLHDHTQFTSTQIAILVGWLHKVKSESATITVSGAGTWSVTQFQAPGGGKHTLPVAGAARGMFIGTGRRGVDDQLILAQRDELIVPPHLVRSGEVDHLRGRIPGFADGGVVGSYRGGVPGLGRFLRAEDSATLAAIERSTAMAVLAGIHAAAAAAAKSFAGAPPGSSGTAVGAVQQWAKAHLADYGWGPSQFGPLQSLWDRESGWRWNALNPSSGAYGIPQALPASKMASAGADWRTNPVTQMRWGLGYIRPVYGSPAGAWAHELAAGWYDQGGWLPPGPSIAINGTGRPERVGGGGTIINLNVTVRVGHGTNPRQAAKEIADILNQGATAGIRLRKSILSANG